MALWYEDRAEVLAFAHYLTDSHILNGVADLLYYFEKPWKWDNEHTFWTLTGWENAEGYIDTTDFSDPENQEALR